MEFKDVILEKIPQMSYTDLREIQNAIELSLDKDNVREKTIALIKAGSILHAIRWVKKSTGMGLKDAKDYVDSLHEQLKSENFDE